MSSPAQVTMFGVPTQRQAPGRFPSKRELLRWILSDHQWHGWRELMKAIGPRYGGRLFELKRAGLRIEKRKDPAGGRSDWEYRIAKKGGAR